VAASSPRIADRKEVSEVKYLVMMEMMEEKVPADPQALIKHVEKVQQEHEIMIRLEEKGTVVAGGGIVGRKADAFIVDVASHNELLALIYSLPLHHVHDVDVLPLADFQIELKHEREGLDHLKQALS
jgi:muconolactone delta-isomerase